MGKMQSHYCVNQTEIYMSISLRVKADIAERVSLYSSRIDR